ncbi:MAG: hypothetical protein D6767_03315 [Candidatus Hydrogenedentota bacterium]|nr:MAG: hypothetical protein D6767_03315 [Candidatus Hydrogenedentota bacterium]
MIYFQDNNQFYKAYISGKEIYVSPDEYKKLKTTLEKIFSSQTSFLAISYDFAKSLLLNESSNKKGLYLAPVQMSLMQENPWLVFPVPKQCKPELSKKEYVQNIVSIQRRMEAGDYYLCNYTFRLFAKAIGKKKILFPKTDAGSFFSLPDAQVLSLSPEVFLRIQENQIHTYPIKGSLSADYNSNILSNSMKEKAEQTMVTDLMRNDLGSICQYGSVHVPIFCKIKKHHGLWQMYSKITGTLQNPFTLGSLLKLLPAGSITGTPKHEVVKQMDKLERSNRDFYSGIAGFYNPLSRSGVFSILIRTFIWKKNRIIFGTGSGITLDSDPAKEYEECLLKFESAYSRLTQEYKTKDSPFL